jgi:glycosyltransferase involved in cell wall biosynthesis
MLSKKKAMPIVTVGIPTYNRSAYLRQAIESVLGQTFGDFKLLISDNASTDDTANMVSEYARTEKRIVYHRFAKNGGLARNVGHVIMTPNTDFIAYLPDDDLWLPHHLESAIDALQKVPNAVLFGCTAEFFEEKPGHDFHQPYWANGKKSRQVIDSTKRFVPWLRETPMAPASVVFRRAAREHITWYNDDSFGAMDWLFWGQIALSGATVFDPAVGVKYRWHKNNQSHSLLNGKRAVVQFRYVIRRLATLALARSALSGAELVEEVVKSWPSGSAATLVVALAAFDSHPELRKAAFEIFERRSELRWSRDSIKHCRMANRAGAWYLGIADVVDRLLGRWWPPA